MNLATVGLADVRPVASGPWIFTASNDERCPILCMVVERNDGELEKEVRDCIVRCADGTEVGAFDFELHAQPCTGPNPAEAGLRRRAPCECGAFPPSLDHQLRRSIAIKRAMQTKAEIEHQDLVVGIDSDGTVHQVTKETKTSRVA